MSCVVFCVKTGLKPLYSVAFCYLLRFFRSSAKKVDPEPLSVWGTVLRRIDGFLHRLADRRRGDRVGVRLIVADVVAESDGDVTEYGRKHPHVIGADPGETAAIKTGTSRGRDRHATTKTPLLP